MNGLKKRIKKIGCTAVLYLFRMCPINPKKVVFGSFFYSTYSDNPRAIFEKMKELRPDYQYIWLIRNFDGIIEGAEVVKADSIKALFHLATAACWIDNSRKREWHRKRKKQFYVQTWHGSIAMKHVEADAADKLPKSYITAAQRDSAMADLLLSGSEWQTEQIKRSFWYNGEIGKFGLPRSDIFFQDHALYKKKVDDYFGCSTGTKYILYAPTFRVDYGLEAYNLDYDRLLKAVECAFSGEWKVLIRLHPNIAKQQTALQYSEKILNASAYANMSELIVSSDILITDYSSCSFDAMEAHKKVFLFCSDVEEYNADRGLEFSFEELPFPFAANNDQMIANIKGFREDVYFSEADTFMKRLGIYDNKDASKNTVNYIFKEMDARFDKSQHMR